MIEKQKIDVSGTYEDYLISRGKQYQSRREENLQKKEKEDPERKECTFSPDIYQNKRAGEDYNSSRHAGSGNKWEELYH